MKRRIICILLAAVLFCGTVSAAPSKSPYAIRVNRALNTVTVYGLDENGEHTVPVKAMICSTARSGYHTPLGTFTLIGYRSEWRLMLDGTYGQYATSFSGNYLFHSICYTEASKDAMIREEYNDLGSPASMGCVRLQTVDAKWIFGNCPAGTKVTVYEDDNDPGPLGKPEKKIAYISPEAHNGWDPTDPSQDNPWTFVKAEQVHISQETKKVRAGETLTLSAAMEPTEAAMCGVTWSSSDPAVARVDAYGTVTGLSAGTAEITAASWNGVQDSCAVKVEGELLPFEDLVPGAWYYKELRGSLEAGVMQGVGGGRFAPSEPMTRAMVVQTLYNLEGQPKTAGKAVFTDVAEEAWYQAAVLWAKTEGLVNGVTETEFAPDDPMSRQELAAVLWRYAGSPGVSGTLEQFADADQAASFAREPLIWMTSQGLLQGAGGSLLPKNTVTRVETAVILQRFTAK